MVSERSDETVGILGAGPVGLFAALALLDRGIAVRVYARPCEREPSARSLLIQPAGLELLHRLGIVDRFLERGFCVRRVRAFDASGAPLGSVALDELGGRHPFVLALGERATEAILLDALEECSTGCVQSVEIQHVEPATSTVRFSEGRSHLERAHAALIACDGFARSSLGVPLDDALPAGESVAADIADETDLGGDAAVFLSRRGPIESWPLAGGRRRWVAPAEVGRRDPADALADAVEAGTGRRMSARAASGARVYRTERGIAAAFGRGRVALVGEAAQGSGAFGGHGTTLAWIEASALADELARTLRASRIAAVERAIAADAQRRRRYAIVAARRASASSWLGRALGDPRAGTLHRLLGGRASSWLTRAFTRERFERPA